MGEQLVGKLRITSPISGSVLGSQPSSRYLAGTLSSLDGLLVRRVVGATRLVRCGLPAECGRPPLALPR